MKVAYLSSFYPFRGGIAQFNSCLYQSFENQYETQAFNFTRQYPSLLFPGKTQYVTEQDNVDAIQSIRSLDSINPLTYYLTARKINKFDPDVLVIMYWISFLAPSLGTVAKYVKPKTKVISILGNIMSHEKRLMERTLTRYFLNQNDGFIAMSERGKNDLLSIKSDAKFLIYPHPTYDHFGTKKTDAVAKKNLQLDLDKKTLLFFGFIRKYKGLDILIEAFNQLDNTYQLVIAGECYGGFEPYQNLIDKSKYKGNIKVFNTYISHDQVPDFFSCADVCVLPYRSSTQSGITPAAYHFDLPMIATAICGLTADGGLIVDEADSTAISNAIKHYFSDNLKDKFIASIRRVKQEYTWDNLAKKIVNFSQTL